MPRWSQPLAHLQPLVTHAAPPAWMPNAEIHDGPTVPQSHAAEHEPGGSDAVDVDTAAGVGSLRTLGPGAAQAAPGNDARLSDARIPTAHAASHAAGQGDPVAVSHVGMAGVSADQHHKRTEAKATGSASSTESVTWTTAFASTPIVVTMKTGDGSDAALPVVITRSTTGASIAANFTVTMVIAQEAT